MVQHTERNQLQSGRQLKKEIYELSHLQTQQVIMLMENKEPNDLLVVCILYLEQPYFHITFLRSNCFPLTLNLLIQKRQSII